MDVHVYSCVCMRVHADTHRLTHTLGGEAWPSDDIGL